jgi:hypothetical protein
MGLRSIQEPYCYLRDIFHSFIYILYVRVCACVRVYINTAIYFLSEVTVVSVSICNLLGNLRFKSSARSVKYSKISSREALSNSPNMRLWKVRERIEARGFKTTGPLVGTITSSVFNTYIRRLSELDQSQKLFLRNAAKQRNCLVLIPDMWLDMLDDMIDRVYSKLPHLKP